MTKLSMLAGKKQLLPASVLRRQTVDNQLKNIPITFFYEYPSDKKGKEKEDTQIINGRMGIGESIIIETDSQIVFEPQEIVTTIIDNATYNITKVEPIRESAYNDRQRRFGSAVPTNIKQRLFLDN